MIYGYASNRVGTIFTHIVGFNQETLEKMEEHSHRYDGSTRSYRSMYEDESIVLSASFVHLNENDHNSFIDDFEIYLVDTKKELQFLKKMLA